MTTVSDELAATLADITGRLVGPADDQAAFLALMTRTVTAEFAATATGILLVDPRGGYKVAAASDDRSQFIELVQAESNSGPCIDCIEHGALVSSTDLTHPDERRSWPEFTARALAAGFRAVHAFPVRLGPETLGGLNVFHSEATTLSTSQLQLAQTLTHFVTLGLTSEAPARREQRLAERSLQVFNERIHFAQAIGWVAGYLGIDPTPARELIEHYAHQHQRPLRDIAKAITTGALNPHQLGGAT